MLKQRVLTAAVLAPGFLLALFFSSPWVWMALMGIATVLASWEWARIAGFAIPGRWGYTILVAILLLSDYLFGVGGVSQPLIWGGVLVFWLVLVPLWLGRYWMLRQRYWLAVVGLALLVPTWLALVALRETSAWLLFFLMGLVWVADIAAYVFGRTWGKHKLAPRISPGKTWEGAAGASLCGVLYTLLWQVLAPQALAHFRGFSTLGLVLMTLFMVAISILGDLFESYMKRGAGLKDSGNLMPGHGGILDRIDSQTSVLPVAFAGLYFFSRWIN